MNFDAFTNPAIAAALNIGNRVTIESINMIETGTYNPLFSRSFGICATPGNMTDVLNNVSERVYQSGMAVTPDLLAGAASALISPDATAGSMLSIPNGWDTARFRATMMVRVDLPSMHTVRYQIQAYSEHGSLSYSGIPDDKMKFYINSITQVVDSVGIDGRSSLIGNGSAQILNGKISMTPTATGVFTVRPRDVVGEIQSQYNISDAGKQFIDNRANLTGRSSGSTRTNAIPSHYLSSTLGTWLTASMQNDLVNDRAVVGSSLTMLAENFYDENHFVTALVSKQGLGNGGWFTLEVLGKLDNTFTTATAFAQNRLNVQRLGGITAHDTAMTGVGSNWNGSDIEAIWAASLGQSLPAIASKYFVGKYGFTATNMNYTGEIIVGITDMRSANISVMNQFTMNTLLGEIKRTILQDLSQNGLIRFSIKAHVDTYGDTRLDIQIDTRPLQTYFMPTFCDAIASPVIAHDRSNLAKLALGMETIARTVTDNVLGDSSPNANLPTITINNSY